MLVLILSVHGHCLYFYYVFSVLLAVAQLLHVAEHQYKSTTPGPENERTMFFHDEARVDGLVKRVETAVEMTEHFKNRDDFLFYKHVDFGKKPKKFGPQDGSTTANVRPILVSIETGWIGG